MEEALDLVISNFKFVPYISLWPKGYHLYLQHDTAQWTQLLDSVFMRCNNEINIFSNFIKSVSENLLDRTKTIETQDLWIFLCEYLSENIDNNSQFEALMEKVLEVAKQERDDCLKHYDCMPTLFRDNPWRILCKNVHELVPNEFDKGKVVLVLYYLACLERLNIFKYLSSKQPKDITSRKKAIFTDFYKKFPDIGTEILLSQVIMTIDRWESLNQIISLLKQKRIILKMLTSNVENQDSEGSKTIKNEEDIIDEEEEVCSSTVSKIIQIETSGITHQNKSYDENTTNQGAPCDIVDQNKLNEPPTETIAENVQVKEEPYSDSEDSMLELFLTVKQENEENIPIKKETSEDFVQNVKEEIKSEPYCKPIKKETFEDFVPNVKEEIKSEPCENEDSVVIVETKQINEKQKSQVKDKEKVIDRLILQYSIQQINKSKNAMVYDENDYINISDDDEEDCVIKEDIKLEVENLLDMYHDMIYNKPIKYVKNPLAAPNVVSEGKEATQCKIQEKQDAIKSQTPKQQTLENLKKYISPAKEMKIESQNQEFPKAEDFISINTRAKQEIKSEYRKQKEPGATFLRPVVVDRNASTSSNRSIKMNTAVSSRKQLKKVKKSRSKTKASVKKLFENLRNNTLGANSSNAANNSQLDNTVIDLDKTTTPQKGIKRKKILDEKFSKRKRYFNNTIQDDSLVYLNDDHTVTPKKQSQVHCSTPITKNSKVLSEFVPITNVKTNNNSVTQNLNDEITDLTKEINRDSYLTIDLTNESLNVSSISKHQNTVIDLDNTVDNDCKLVSVSNTNLSLSGESDVTVLNISQAKKERQMKKFVRGITKLDAAEKGRLFDLITQNIFGGCNVLDHINKPGPSDPSANPEAREKCTKASETVEDTYIKEVILGEAVSRNSIGSNIYNPEKDIKNKTGLRMIVIDGSNVAMDHSKGRFFSVKGLKICIDYFLSRGHVVKAFVPRFRCKFGKSSNPGLLDQLERRGLVVYTPSREVQGRTVTSYDDRYIVQCAAEFDGVIVSGDNYRDLLLENPRWRPVIENRLLQFTWVNDMIMFPRDPCGRNGPSLEQFLKHSSGPSRR